MASTSYEGSADQQGRWQGYGKVVFKSGATYEGQWLTGKMHGRGKFVFPDGISYEGEFQHNQMTGTGVGNFGDLWRPCAAILVGENVTDVLSPYYPCVSCIVRPHIKGCGRVAVRLSCDARDS